MYHHEIRRNAPVDGHGGQATTSTPMDELLEAQARFHHQLIFGEWEWVEHLQVVYFIFLYIPTCIK
jgi:hypothetical protein